MVSTYHKWGLLWSFSCDHSCHEKKKKDTPAAWKPNKSVFKREHGGEQREPKLHAVVDAVVQRKGGCTRSLLGTEKHRTDIRSWEEWCHSRARAWGSSSRVQWAVVMWKCLHIWLIAGWTRLWQAMWWRQMQRELEDPATRPPASPCRNCRSSHARVRWFAFC